MSREREKKVLLGGSWRRKRAGEPKLLERKREKEKRILLQGSLWEREAGRRRRRRSSSKMPKVKTGRIHGSYFPDYELRRRETGLGKTLGWDSGIRRSLYSSMIPSTFWDPIEHDPKTGFTGHGGVFNLEFSPDG